MIFRQMEFSDKKSMLLALCLFVAGLAAGFSVHGLLAKPEPSKGSELDSLQKRLAAAEDGASRFKTIAAGLKKAVNDEKSRAGELENLCENLKTENTALQEKLQSANDNKANEELAPHFNQCMDKASGSDFAMKDCYQEALEYWDGQLNGLYARVVKVCNDDANPEACKSKLKKMQTSWIAYKDIMSDYIYSGEITNKGGYSGSLNRLSGIAFLAEETKGQFERLKYFVDN